tara:strand:- start:12 stop:461 length:450 start_codon:yes stop_codon:yes gene_type:complete
VRNDKIYPHASADWEAGRARCVQLREPRTLLVYYLSQGVSEFDWGAAGPAAATAANAAAARQTMPAAGASGELRSQAKNQAFPSFLYSSGISEMSRPGIYTFASCPVKMLRKIFFAENWDFIPKVELSISGRARCLLRLMGREQKWQKP